MEGVGPLAKAMAEAAVPVPAAAPGTDRSIVSRIREFLFPRVKAETRRKEMERSLEQQLRRDLEKRYKRYS